MSCINTFVDFIYRWQSLITGTLAIGVSYGLFRKSFDLAVQSFETGTLVNILECRQVYSDDTENIALRLTYLPWSTAEKVIENAYIQAYGRIIPNEELQKIRTYFFEHKRNRENLKKSR